MFFRAIPFFKYLYLKIPIHINVCLKREIIRVPTMCWVLLAHSLTLASTLGGRHFYVANDGAKAQRWWGTCPVSYASKWQSWDSTPNPPKLTRSPLQRAASQKHLVRCSALGIAPGLMSRSSAETTNIPNGHLPEELVYYTKHRN